MSTEHNHRRKSIEMTNDSQPNALQIGELFRTIFADLGVYPPKTFDFKQEFLSILVLKISPSMCGPLASMFESIDVDVQVGVTGTGDIVFHYDYQYSHSMGGSNGYTVRKRINKADHQS